MTLARTAERCGFDRVGVADHFWQHPAMGGPEAAELRGDTAFLEYTLADGFAGIGPRGFMLTGEQWLARYESGDLKHESFLLDDVQVRTYEDAAVMTGHETIKGKYKDHGVEGQVSHDAGLRKAARTPTAGHPAPEPHGRRFLRFTLRLQ